VTKKEKKRATASNSKHSEKKNHSRVSPHHTPPQIQHMVKKHSTGGKQSLEPMVLKSKLPTSKLDSLTFNDKT
jgi:hypothetical protein